MINVLNLPKTAKSFYGWRHDCLQMVCQDLLAWRDFKIGEAYKVFALCSLVRNLSEDLGRVVPENVQAAMTEAIETLSPRRGNRPQRSHAEIARVAQEQAAKRNAVLSLLKKRVPPEVIAERLHLSRKTVLAFRRWSRVKRKEYK